ncbi:MAG: hypothetical protein JWR70_3224 [Modestobacter sp.]|jgi:hypothetical protein|nr:hypothetical protein [Modestobacter sp.]
MISLSSMSVSDTSFGAKSPKLLLRRGLWLRLGHLSRS